MKQTFGEYEIDDDRTRLPLPAVHRLLAQTYWAAERSVETIARSIEHSLASGIYRGSELVGFARVVTDYATFGWVCDVVIDPAHRGRELGKKMMETLLAHEALQGVRLLLATKDAHTLYEQYGFERLPEGMCMGRGFSKLVALLEPRAQSV